MYMATDTVTEIKNNYSLTPEQRVTVRQARHLPHSGVESYRVFVRYI